MRAPCLVITGDLWGKACAVAGMKAGDSLGGVVKSASIFVREIARERKQGRSRERLALNEQDSEGKWAGSMLGYRAELPWGPQATVGSQGRPAPAFLPRAVIG